MQTAQMRDKPHALPHLKDDALQGSMKHSTKTITSDSSTSNVHLKP